MGLSLEEKRQVVAKVAEVAARAHSAVAAEYRGLKVSELTQLRVKVRQVGAHMQVVRNTLARRALAGTDFECLASSLTGPLILVFGLNDPASVARVVGEFGKTNDKLVVRNVAFGGRVFPASDLDVLAKLPTREEALALLMSVLNGPITKLVRTIAEPHARLVRTIGAVRDQKQAA